MNSGYAVIALVLAILSICINIIYTINVYKKRKNLHEQRNTLLEEADVLLELLDSNIILSSDGEDGHA